MSGHMMASPIPDARETWRHLAPGGEISGQAGPCYCLFRWALTLRDGAFLEAEGWREVARHPLFGSALMRRDTP